jgi:hypothetical protein
MVESERRGHVDPKRHDTRQGNETAAVAHLGFPTTSEPESSIPKMPPNAGLFNTNEAIKPNPQTGVTSAEY